MIKLLSLEACNSIKERLKHVSFPCEYCEFFKNTCFEELLRMAAFEKSNVNRSFQWKNIPGWQLHDQS